MGKNKKNDFPDIILGGSGKNWFRFGDILVNGSKEGWDSMEQLWDYFVLIALIVGGVICFFCGLIFLAVILVGLGIWGFCSTKACNWISTIITWSIVICIVIGIFWLLS